MIVRSASKSVSIGSRVSVFVELIIMVLNAVTEVPLMRVVPLKIMSEELLLKLPSFTQFPKTITLPIVLLEVSIPFVVIFRILKLVTPVPDIISLVPLKLTVPVELNGVVLVLLLIQLPFKVIVFAAAFN